MFSDFCRRFFPFWKTPPTPLSRSRIRRNKKTRFGGCSEEGGAQRGSKAAEKRGETTCLSWFTFWVPFCATCYTRRVLKRGYYMLKAKGFFHFFPRCLALSKGPNYIEPGSHTSLFCSLQASQPTVAEMANAIWWRWSSSMRHRVAISAVRIFWWSVLDVKTTVYNYCRVSLYRWHTACSSTDIKCMHIFVLRLIETSIYYTVIHPLL